MATAAAAIVAKARREIQHHFFSVDAVRPDRAVVFTPTGRIETGQFEKMLERGTIRRESADRYWIDVVAYDRDLQQRYRRVRIALVVLVALLAVGIVMLAASGGPAAAT